jgi:hypothetical protein
LPFLDLAQKGGKILTQIAHTDWKRLGHVRHRSTLVGGGWRGMIAASTLP